MALVCGVNPHEFMQWPLPECMRWGMASVRCIERFRKGSKDGKDDGGDLLEQFGTMAAQLSDRGLLGIKHGGQE